MRSLETLVSTTSPQNGSPRSEEGATRSELGYEQRNAGLQWTWQALRGPGTSVGFSGVGKCDASRVAS